MDPTSSGRKQHTTVDRCAPIGHADPRLSNDQAAKYLGLSPSTLNNWRSKRYPDRSIPFEKVGRLVWYRQSRLDKFLAACERDTESASK